MLEKAKVLAIIPARGGSKGVPRKNVRLLGNKPLIHWTLEAAKNSMIIDRIVVSSDDDEILSTAAALHCSVQLRRPAEFATDHSTSADVVLHVLESHSDYDIVVLLQPTSPFRRSSDIDECLKILRAENADSCVSVREVTESPYWMYRLAPQRRLAPLLDETSRFTRRQDLPKIYMPNGAVYAFRAAWMQAGRQFINTDTVGYVMPDETSLDIDTEADFAAAEYAVSNNRY